MANHQRRGGRALRSVFLALPLAALACACSQEMPGVLVTEPNILPANYKSDILAYMRNYLNDPTGVRGAYIAEPELRNIPGASTQRYMVCLRYNARDLTGKYKGSHDFQVAFLSGRLDTLVPAGKDQCEKANWQPFPELEKLKR